MDIITKNLDVNTFDFKPFDRYFSQLRMGVFDLETTGLSPNNSQIILAGLLTEESGKLTSTQFFSESLSDEEELLFHLKETMAKLDYVITYNGKSFDMPFLTERIYNCQLPPWPNIYNLDIYNLVKNFSDIRQFTPNLKQKTLETFMGISLNRQDEISGKESVMLYHQYLHHREDSIKEKILLHNAEDISQLYKLLRVAEKTNFHKAMFKMGFPMKCSSISLNINEIKILQNKIFVSGYQQKPHINYIAFDDNTLSYNFYKSKFDISIPIIHHKELILADLKVLEVDMETAIDNYSVLANNNQLYYSEINDLITVIIERIIKQWITKK